MTRLPSITVTREAEETVTFADGTTVTRWSRTITGGHTPTTRWNNYLITAPSGHYHTTIHDYHENETQ